MQTILCGQSNTITPAAAHDPPSHTMNPKKRPMSSSNSTGYRGVYRISARFRAKIYFDGKINDLGTFATAKEAGLAYDHAITHHCLTRKLNFPDGLPLDDEDYEELMHPDKEKTLIYILEAI